MKRPPVAPEVGSLHRRRRLVLAAFLLVLTGSALVAARPGPVLGIVPAPLAVTAAVVPTGASTGIPAVRKQRLDRLATAGPVGLDIPAIGVHTRALQPLGRDAGGVLEGPSVAGTAGWSEIAPAPGSLGPAVIAGHIDLDGVPGVFARLAEITPGTEISVHRADGTATVFGAYRVERFPRESYPTGEVHGDTPGPELRLITWGGVFDRGVGRHPDNVVVFARQLG